MRRAGFTLLEISAVVAVIGLLIGSVIVGRELLYASEIRKQLQEFEALNTAIITFETKYNGLPGDLPNATRFFYNVVSGDNNGSIGFLPTNGTNYCLTGWNSVGNREGCWMWGHLFQAGLWSFDFNLSTPEPIATRQCGPNATFPCFMNRRNVGYIVETRAGRHQIAIVSDSRAGTGTYFGSHYLYGYPAMSPNEAKIFDDKIDDGRPTTGRMIARRGNRLDPVVPNGGQWQDACIANTPQLPYRNSNNIDCTITIDTSF